LQAEADMNDARSSTDKSYQDLEAELGKLRGDIASLAKTVRDIGSSEAQVVLDAVKDRLDRVSTEARRASRRAKAGAQDAADTVQGAIEENPFTSVLIALGLGFIIGAFLRR
jgi:ElaB/YqjD/DUF883 family membrane-anchored ribosome-binding protein